MTVQDLPSLTQHERRQFSAAKRELNTLRQQRDAALKKYENLKEHGTRLENSIKTERQQYKAQREIDLKLIAKLGAQKEYLAFLGFHHRVLPQWKLLEFLPLVSSLEAVQAWYVQQLAKHTLGELE